MEALRVPVLLAEGHAQLVRRRQRGHVPQVVWAEGSDHPVSTAAQHQVLAGHQAARRRRLQGTGVNAGVGVHVHMHVSSLTLRSTQASSWRLLLNRHSTPELVMQKVLPAVWPRPHATPQKTLALWSPSNPERPIRGTAVLTWTQKRVMEVCVCV